jgi:hypothetical protein
MQKCGMRREGVLRRHIRKWDVFEDVAVFGILRDEFDGAAAARPVTAGPTSPLDPAATRADS